MTGVDDNVPRKVLIISAEMGEGHNAAATALTEAMQECWPGCEVERLDTMELRGVRFARAARWAYGFQLSALPWTYEVFYAWLSRSDGFARAARRWVGDFFGPRLQSVVEKHHPDLVISTYPFGSAALDWLRRAKGYSTPSVTYIPAFHVHPLWVYEGIDLHFVMYDTAAADAMLPSAAESLRVGAPPVRRGFGDYDSSEVRLELGIPKDDFVVLQTGGAWGLGDLRPGVEALVNLEPPVHVLAVCGKNAGLQSELEALAARRPGRLTVFGYTSQMPELMSAANVVVTNGAGVTVLEALRTPRPVVCFAPLAGHGTFSTAEMVRRNLAVEAKDVSRLVEQIRLLRTDEELLRTMEKAGEAWVEGRDMVRSVHEIGDLYKQKVQASGHR